MLFVKLLSSKIEVRKNPVPENPYPPQERLTEIPGGGGAQKHNFFQGKYGAKFKFQRGWGVQTKKPSVGRGREYGHFLEQHNTDLVIV